MNEQILALDVLVQEKLDADTDFLATIEGKTDDERNVAITAKRTEIMNTEWSKAQEYARNQKIRAEKAEEKPTKVTTKDKDDSNLSSVDTIAIIKANVHEDDIDEVISFQARQMVKQFALSHSMEMADALIAATAIFYNELLCTSNAKHFLPCDGLMLEIYSPLKI